MGGEYKPSVPSPAPDVDGLVLIEDFEYRNEFVLGVLSEIRTRSGNRLYTFLMFLKI